MVEVMKNLKLDNQKTLIVTKEKDEFVVKSANNLQKIKALNTKQINVYDLLNATKLLITEDATKAIEEVYA